MQSFDGTFWLSLSGIIIGFASGALIYCIKSKCSKCSLCFGLINIERDVKLETDEQQFEIEHGVNPFKNGEEKA